MRMSEHREKDELGDRNVARKFAQSRVSGASPYRDNERDKLNEGFLAGAKHGRAQAEAVHKNHSPCALRVLGEFYEPDEAYGIAIECTCFPMDCEQASRQAVKFLADVFECREREAAEG